MEEEKKEGLENIEGQRRLPPRPMPPRPPLMKKQIVIEGEKEQAVVENLQAEQTKTKLKPASMMSQKSTQNKIMMCQVAKKKRAKSQSLFVNKNQKFELRKTRTRQKRERMREHQANLIKRNFG